MTEEELKYIVTRLIDNANDSMEEFKQNPKSEFYDGKTLAYYEMLDTIKNELLVRDVDLKEYGLDINLEEKFFDV